MEQMKICLYPESHRDTGKEAIEKGSEDCNKISTHHKVNKGRKKKKKRH